MGATVDEEYGGLGLDYLSLTVAIEELSRGCASTGMILSIHNFLYANLVNERGTPEQKEMFLKDFTKGAIGCFALSEPGEFVKAVLNQGFKSCQFVDFTVQCCVIKQHSWVVDGLMYWILSDCFKLIYILFIQIFVVNKISYPAKKTLK